MPSFSERVENAYGLGAYDLSRSVFSGNTSPVEVVCPDHGPFSLTPDNFLYNRGCPDCRGFHPRAYPDGSKRKTLKKQGRPSVAHSFYIHAVGDDFIKIGITSGDVEARRVAVERGSSYDHVTVYVKTFESRGLCVVVERLIKSLYPMRVPTPLPIYDGTSEITKAEFLPEIVTLVESLPVRSRQGT